jgi:hypothetical protein
MTDPSKPAREGDYGLLRDAADIAVEGSLSAPPIVLRQDRLKLSLGFVGFSGLAAGLLGVLDFDSTLHILAFCFIGLTALDYGLGAIVPTTLTLGPAGLVRRSVYRTVTFPWQDLTDFRWYRTRMSGNTIMAVHSNGVATQLGGYWELPVQQVVDQLTAALAHWGPKK